MTRPRLGSLFTGAGMLDAGVRAVVGGTIAWHCENDPAASRLLAHHWPGVPNLGDITRIDWTQVEPVDVLAGGFPCQDVSLAGGRAGMHGHTRSGLWAEYVRAIDMLRPELVVIENVRGLLSAEAGSDMEPCPWCVGDEPGQPVLRALGAVLGDLAGLGYDAEWVGLRAADVGAPHGRFRIFIVAYPASDQGRRDHGDDVRAGWGAGRLGPTTRPGAAADASGDGRHERGPESAGLVGGSDAAVSGATPPDTESGSRTFEPSITDGARTLVSPELGAGVGVSAGDLAAGIQRLERSTGLAWGPYAAAIRRWESTLGRPAPPPTTAGPKGGQRLNPDFTDWMMGWPDHWTDIPGLSRNDRLRICGNGVVPQQATAALRWLLRTEAAA